MSLTRYLTEIETRLATETDAERRGSLIAYKRYVEVAIEATRVTPMELAV